MPAENYRIFQGQILDKDPNNPRQYSVMQIPEGFTLTQVQLPNALKDQSTPLLGSLVLVLQLADYSAYILSVLREPFEFLSANQQYRGFIPSTGNSTQDIQNQANPIQDGEVFMEATGPTSPTGQGIPGFGAHLYLGNNGCAQIESGSTGERLVIGGTSSDDDHEVLLSADNGYFESNLGSDHIQSTFNFTTNSITGLTEGLQIATQLSVPAGLTTVETPIAELTMDTIGNITLRNTVFGTGQSLASLVMDATGGISLSSGVAGVPQATIDLQPVGTVNINSGTLPAARLSDLVVSSTATDLTYWLFINAIQGFFTALSGFQGGSPVLQSQLGALGAAFLLQSPIAPPSMMGKITTGSNSVVVGG